MLVYAPAKEAGEVMNTGGCQDPLQPAQREATTCGEMLRVWYTSQDCYQHSRSHAGDLGRDSLPDWLDWHHCSHL